MLTFLKLLWTFTAFGLMYAGAFYLFRGYKADGETARMEIKKGITIAVPGMLLIIAKTILMLAGVI